MGEIKLKTSMVLYFNPKITVVIAYIVNIPNTSNEIH